MNRGRYRKAMAEPTTARPGIDPVMQALLDAFPFTFTADDGARYAELLAAAGVPAQLHNAETLIHGYLGYAGVVPAATDAMDRGLSALRNALHAT